MNKRRNIPSADDNIRPAEISEQMLLDAFLCEIVVIDTEKRIVKANEAYCMARGASLAQILGMPIEACGKADSILKALEYPTETKLVFQEDNDIVALSSIFSDGKRVGAMEMRFHHRGMADVAAMEMSYSHMAEDIHKLFETNWDVIYASDDTGRTLEVSSAATAIWGVDAEQLVGKSVYELEKERIFYPSITRMVLESKRRVQAIQTTATGKKLLVMGTPIFDEENRIVRVINTSRLIVDESEFSQELNETRLLLEGYKRELARSQMQEEQNNAFIAESPAMKKIAVMALKVSETDVPVLITGDSGVGKEVLANFIHAKSPRAEKPYIKINCSALPPTLFESELFGYERGAFTGAERSGKPGLFELAQSGTLFLDEISEIPVGLQAKLLRVLQDNEFMRVGGTKTIPLDLRIIAASNKELPAEIDKGLFRRDLYYRLNVVHFRIPPLRERQEDILPLSLFFLKKYNAKYRLNRRLSADVMDAFSRSRWDGNTRELQHAIERMVVLAPQDVIGVDSLPESLQSDLCSEPVRVEAIIPLREAQRLVEEQLIEMARRQYRTTTRIAEALGVDQSTISRKLKRR
ncbi:sigma 54-interacting transcriptional regulator [Selenomonas sp. TAMA-11512]|uniref:sigma 54-interacting transcriptional regulator n=1 Tax=Selenomonas sp. TAMA-11512 TaxID=3095337 RepID=UPI00308D5410|nr:sigma 54-interacting transcriptional regulator [Selenomonas sp. TAMA-11512]